MNYILTWRSLYGFPLAVLVVKTFPYCRYRGCEGTELGKSLPQGYWGMGKLYNDFHSPRVQPEGRFGGRISNIEITSNMSTSLPVLTLGINPDLRLLLQITENVSFSRICCPIK